MQTPAILNVNAAQNGSQAAKPADNGGADSSFNQMLSQQIDQRRAADNSANQQPAKADDSNKTPNADANNKANTDANNKANADASNKANADANNKTAAADKGKDATDATDAANKIALARKKAAVDDDKNIAAADAVLPTVTDMIALANGKALKGDVKTDDGKAVDVKAMTVDATAAVSDKLDTAAKVKGDAADAIAADKTDAKPQMQDGDIKAAPVKTEPDFKAALKQAKDTKETAQTNERPALKGDDKPLNVQTQTANVQHAAAEKMQDKAIDLAAAKVQDAPVVTAALPQVQQAALHVAQTATAAPSDTLTPQVGSTAWNQALGQKVVWMVHGEQQSASLTLNPPDLGPLQVVLSVNNGHADASFYASQPEVRQALEAALPTLRDMMGSAGIQLGQASVNAGTPDQRQAEQQMQQGSRISATHDSGNDIIVPAQRQTAIGGVGLVDTFA